MAVQADPDDDRLEQFDCGSDDAAKAINRFFRSAAWLKIPNCVPLRFDLEGRTAGFAAVKITTEEYPEPGSPTKAPYLSLYALGVNTNFRGKRLPGERSYGDCAFEVFEWFAEEQQVVGVQLHVRTSNTGAIRLYARHGLSERPAGPFLDRRGVEMIAMWKDASEVGRLICQADV